MSSQGLQLDTYSKGGSVALLNVAVAHAMPGLYILKNVSVRNSRDTSKSLSKNSLKDLKF
ncbi:hypothetical protein GW750_02405 [bacterium]|nr:hypothetical protein [bacterium]